MPLTRGAVPRLVAAARDAKRPRWSQAFLAEELRRRGFPASRDQIARLERCAPCAYSPELVAAVAAALDLSHDVVCAAIIEDYSHTASRVRASFGGMTGEPPSG